MKKLLAKIRKLLRDRRTRQIITRFVSITAAVVVFVTTYALVLPAITMESEAYCGIPAHQHSDDCYELQLTCEIPESPGHQHTDECYSTSPVLVCETEEHEHSADNGCYDEEGNLICTKAEHTHNADDNCYEEERVLICEEVESEGHTHDDSCYEKVLTCGLEVHTHSTECYVNPAEGTTTEAAVEVSSGGASTGAAAASTGVSSTGATEEDAVEYDFKDGNEAAGTGDNSNTGATEATENSSTALTTVENAAAGVTADGSYIPQLEQVDFTRVLDNHTGIYYHAVADGETVEDSTALTYDQWNRVDKDTELGVNDLLRVYLAYTVPAGSLNATNQVARYRIPANLHLTEAQIKAINENVNGIAGQYVNMSTLEILDIEKYYAYLGIEAVEGTRRPDEDVNEYLRDLEKAGKDAVEYISAIVRVENMYDEQSGEYEGQDLVVTFTPYSIEKNAHQYDSDGQPTKAGTEIEGWLTLDFNLGQVDWDETSVDTFEREVDTTVDAEEAVDAHRDDDEENDENNSDEQAVEDQGVDPHTVETVERCEQTAEIVFAAEGRDENNNKIHEISTTLTVVEETVVDVQTVEDQPAVDDQFADDQDAEKAGEGATEEAVAATTEEAAVEDQEKSDTGDTNGQNAESEQYSEGTLTAEGDGYRITLDYTAEAKIPENAELKVSEITAESDPEAYEACLEQARASINADEASESGQTVDKKATRFFDIEIQTTVTDENGQETIEKVEPAAPVAVNIQLENTDAATSSAAVSDNKSSVGNEQASQDPTILHFAEEGVEKIESTTVEAGASSASDASDTADDDGTATGNLTEGVQEIQFQAESFSIYGVVYKKLSTTVLTASGETYEITVSYGEDAGIPDGAELKVEEILPEDERYEDYYQQASQVALGDAVNRGIDIPTVDSARLFDIEIRQGEEKVEPTSPVQVYIRLVGAGADLLSVVHFAEEGPEAMALASSEGVQTGGSTVGETEAALEADSAEEETMLEVRFDTSAFSVYTVVSVNNNTDLVNGGPWALVTGISTDPGATTGYEQSWGQDYFTIIVNAQAMMGNDGIVAIPETTDNTGWVEKTKGLGAEGVHTWTDSEGNNYVGGGATQWQFESAANGRYRIFTNDDGTKKYITHNNAEVSLTTNTWNATAFSITLSGDQETVLIHDGNWYLHNNAANAEGNVNWSGWVGRNYIMTQNYSAPTGNSYKYRLCKESDAFDSFAARKVSVQNLTSSDNFIIYRKFVEEDGSEQLYALASDGTFVRVYDGGDTVYWRDTNKNIYWNYLPTGTYYSIFSRDPSTNELVYLNPMDSTGQMITGSASRLTLIGKDEGEYGTTIENWDQKAYDYAGLHVTLDNDGVPNLSTGTRAAETSDEFLFAVAGTMPGGEAETVATVDSEALGIHITMYDYGDWTKEYAAGDKVDEMSAVVNSDTDNDGNYTTAVNYTPHAAHSLVKKYLEEGVPSSSKDGAMTALFPSEDVAYSDSYSSTSKVTEYAKTGVTNLFLRSYYEENGMFRYRSEDNFAYLGNNGETSFKVYRQAATPYTTDTQPGHTYYYHGHYMPFNDIDMDQHVGRLMNQYGNEYTNGEIVGELPVGDGRTYEEIYGTQGIPNFFTGMKMEATFTQPEKGVLENGDDMIFRFTGDDDMWVYIDGILVLDVGGIHEPLTGSINFRTGEVINPVGSSLYGSNGKTTLKAIFDSVLNDNSTPESVKQKIREIEWNGNTFADYSNHDFKSFYMERGAGASNLDLQFNLKVTLTDQITVKKELPEGIDSRFVNQTYRFRATYKDNGEVKPLFAGATRERSGQTEVVCTKVYYKGYTDETTGRPIEPEVDVDENGYFSLRPGEEVVFKMSDKNIEYTISEIGIDTDLVEKVEVNGQVATVEAGTVTAAYARVEDRSQMNYRNHPVLQELNIIKHILPELTDEDKTAQFEFRVYLESMVDVDGELVQQLVPYSYGPYYVTKMVEGVKHYYTMTGTNNAPEDKGTEPVVCSTTGRSGSINSIPPEYTVEIRNLAVGTHFYVEERRDNIPAGYTFDHEDLREGTYDPATDIPDIDRIIARDETDHQEFDPETVGKLNKDGGPAVSDIYNRRIKTFVKKQWSDTSGKVYESMEEITELPNARDAVITAELWKKNVVEPETEDEAVTVTFMVNTTDDELYHQVGEPLVIKKGSALEFSLGAKGTSKADAISASTEAEIVRSNATSNPAIEYTNGRKKEKWSKYTISSVNQDTTIYATFDTSKVGDDFVGRYIALSEAPGSAAQIIDEKVKDITLNVGNEWNVSVPQEDGYIYYLKEVEETGLPDNGSYVFNGNPVIITDDNGNITISLINTYRERTQMTVQKEWDPELPADQAGSAYAKVELHRYVKKSKGVIDVTLKDELFGIPIADAVFKLQKLSEDGESYEDVKTVTTDVNGVAGVSELDPGVYRFVQHSTPDGFSMENHTTVTDTFEVVDNTTEKQEKHFELTNTALQTAGVVTLTVTDNHGDPVMDAEFTLYDSTGRALERGRLTDEEGKIVAGPLDAGTYYFEQTSTSDDYKMPGNTRTESFTVVENPGDPQLFDLSMTNTLKGRGTVTVSLIKEDNNGPIVGATFQLMQGNIEVSTAVTGSSGVATFENVYEGDYTIHQVNTDQAYKVDTVDKSATIADNGEVNQTVNLSVSNKAVGKGTVTVTLKTDDTNAPISGARFVLLEDGNLVSEDYTDDNGVATFEDVLEGTYIVQQTSLGSTGNDYKIVEYEYPVTIRDNGDANQAVDVDAVNYVKGKGTVTVTLTKKDSNEPISGATFQLNQGDAIIQTGETNSDGVVVFSNVYEGNYTVHQVDTAEGYVVDTEDRNVTIQDNGTANQQVSVAFTNNEDSRTYRVYIHGTGKNWNGSDYTNKWYKYYTSGTAVTIVIDLQNLSWITSEEHIVKLNGTQVGSFKYNSPFAYTFTVNGDIEIELGKVTDQNASNIWSRVTFSPDSNSNEAEYTASNNKQSALLSMSASRRLTSSGQLRARAAGDGTISDTDTDSGTDIGSGTGSGTNTGKNSGSGTGTAGSGSGSATTVARSSEAPTDYMDDGTFKEEYTLRKSDDWSHAFENLDKYDESGNLYYYYVVETESFPSGYSLFGYTDEGSNTITITNSKQQGSINITKAVTINGLAPNAVDNAIKNKADGTYTFKIYASDGVTEVTKKADGSDIGTLSITITDGVPDKAITVDKLAPATYIVKETGTTNSETAVDTTVTGYDAQKGGISVVVTAGNTSGIQTAAFTNKYVGYEVIIVKVDTELTSKTLNGAKFDLYAEQYVNPNGTIKDGAIATKTGLETAGTGDGKGKVSLGMLTSGKYYLFETKAPDGYNQLTEPVEINISENNTISLKQWNTQRNGTITQTYKTELTVMNTAGVELPSTGGPGTRFIYLAGAVLTLAAALLLLHRRKRIGT